MKSVLVICQEKDQPFYLKTMLGGRDLHLRMETDLLLASQAIVRIPPDLLIIRGPSREYLEEQFKNLASLFPAVPFPVVVVGDSEGLPGLPEFVKNVLPARCDIGHFNEAVSELLKLATRQRARFPVRIGMDLSASALSIIANTVKISATGMLIESPKALAVGGAYEFKFMAVAKIATLPPIKIRILMEETPPEGVKGVRHYAAEFLDMPPERMDKIIEELLS